LSGDIGIRIDGFAGRIVLDRPQVLNALSHGMLDRIASALDQWERDDRVRLVLIEGAGGRAFCAGGDIQLLYRTGRDEPGLGRKFWFDEYRLNARIHRYPKPYVAIMDGISMGGGVGISAHGSHRIVTERSAVTMPEAGIGFMPDVGSTRILADAPGETGFYLGLAARRMDAADAIYAGFADRFVPSESLPDLKRHLAETGDAETVAEFAKPPPPSDLARNRARIDACFGQSPLENIVAALEAGTDEWDRTTLAALRRVSPFSAAATFEAITYARKTPGLEPCLANEYRFAFRSLEGGEFYEGIRAAVIDKDRQPKWRPSRIEDVTPESVAAVFAPLGNEEWRPAA
jgi:enoyl-CoA hydratase